MRGSLVLLLVVGCGTPNPGSGIDAPPDEIDGAVDGDGNVIVDAPLDATIDDGPPAMVCPANTWCTETAPIAGTVDLRDVYVRDSADVLAVGTAGTIIRRRNDGWAAMTSGTTETLLGVWAASATDAWVVGENGTVRRWNGTSWSAVAGAPNIDFTGVWGSGPDDVWLIGTSTAAHWTGSGWGTSATFPGTLNSVHGSGPGNIWIAGEPTYLKRYNGTSWMTVMPGGGTTQYSVLALSPTNVWATAPGSGSRNFNGTTWTPYASDAFMDLHAFTATDIWGVAQTMAGHWNGTAWISTTPTGVTNPLRAVSGAGGHLWIVGSDAKILHRN
jgi:hypothetical protein